VALAVLPQSLIHGAAAVSNGQAAVAMPEAVQDLSFVCGALLPGVCLRTQVQDVWVAAKATCCWQCQKTAAAALTPDPEMLSAAKVPE
jgi:hypothetical protein